MSRRKVGGGRHDGGPLSRWEDAWDSAPDDDEYGDEYGDGDDWEGDAHERENDWRRPAGIFVLGPVGGEAGEMIARIQRRYDPKLAAMNAPHVTLVGSSGVGPIRAGTSLDEMRAALEPVCRAFPPLPLRFGAPTRFMQTNIVSLPLDPNGPVRELYERIRGSGLSFGSARFAFTPHVTLSYFPTLDRGTERALLSERVEVPALLERMELSLTNDPLPPRKLASLPLMGAQG